MLDHAEIKALEVLAYFFYQTGNAQSSLRAVKALLAVEPKNEWARVMLILCFDKLNQFDRVAELTANLKQYNLNKKQEHALSLVRARALQKLGRTGQARELVASLAKQEQQ